MTFASYPETKPSGVDWLGDVPKNWTTKRLKFAASVSPSNVDKNSVEGQSPVLLCNYTDVYKNDNITRSIEFMSATAPDEQIKRFRLRYGDVLMTKDSESPDDIGVPAVVTEDLEGVVCGYHLALLRPSTVLDGKYLRYSLASPPVRDQFHMAANGVTRYGLSRGDIADSVTPLPPLPEQQQITAFLDRKTAEIDNIIGLKERQIALLAEQRQALISRAVTRGLDPNMPLKPSGIEWLGDVPEHWDVKPLKYSMQFRDSQRIPLSSEERADKAKVFPYYGASGIIDHVDEYIFDEDLILIGEDGANLYSRSTPLAFVATGKYWVNNHAHILKPKNGNLRYWVDRLNSISYAPFITGSAQPKLTAESLGSISFASPPEQEQQAIVNYLDRETARMDGLGKTIEAQIGKLREWRQALISAAVTGKIDVRCL